jgi:hypothetical protein
MRWSLPPVPVGFASGHHPSPIADQTPQRNTARRFLLTAHRLKRLAAQRPQATPKMHSAVIHCTAPYHFLGLVTSLSIHSQRFNPSLKILSSRTSQGRYDCFRRLVHAQTLSHVAWANVPGTLPVEGRGIAPHSINAATPYLRTLSHPCSMLMPSLSVSTPVICAAALISVLYVARKYTKARAGSKLPLPPGPKKLPLVGNLFDVPTTFEWETWMEWSKIYSNLRSPFFIYATE